MVSLICEHDEDGVEKTNQGQRGEERKESILEECFTSEIPDPVSGDDTGHKRDTEVL